MIFLQDADVTLYQGDVLDVLRELPDQSVHMCCTSPPFYGLRDYGTGEWKGGNPGCDHAPRAQQRGTFDGGMPNSLRDKPSNVCKCGARRVDQQIGLEETPDLWVDRLVAVFREVRRVLRDDGTLWVEIGDSYSGPASGSAQAMNGMSDGHRASYAHAGQRRGAKSKDLIGAPWLLAFALRADGWYLRSEIIWAKPNPMPESVTDRPTTSHSRVFLLTKQARYFYDADAVREPHLTTASGTEGRTPPPNAGEIGGMTKAGNLVANGWIPNAYNNPAGRNRRSVWTIPTQPYPEAHFATWPEALVRPMVLAGTSEKGVCGECGTPIQRVQWVNAEDDEGLHHRSPAGPSNGDKAGLRHGTPASDVADAGPLSGFDRGSPSLEWSQDGQQAGEPGSAAEEHARPQGETASRPSVPTLRQAGSDSSTSHACPSCGFDGLAVPAVVLDPFAGSGTTCHVARKLGRRSIGIDLNPQYLELAARRLQQQSLFA